MNHIKSAVCGLLLAIPIAYSNAAVAGAILLAAEDGSTCTVPLPVLPNTYVRYNLRRDGSPCSSFNDKARTITFLEVPSATEVSFSDHEGYPKNNDDRYSGVCGKDEGNFLIYLTTTKRQTTTRNIELDHLATYAVGQIIAPGLQMKYRNITSHLRNSLSCISIRISEAPPLPAP